MGTEHASVAEALVAALADLTGVPKTRTAKIPTKNGGEYKYEYANIEDVIEHTRPVLASHGLVALQPTCSTEQGMGIRTVILHTSGETFDGGTLPFRSAADPQRDGMGITYYRRYALLAALGMAAEDDDGQVTRPDHAAPEPPAPKGVTPAEMLDKIKAHMADASDENVQAAWRHAAPKAAPDKLIYETEQARVLAAVDAFEAGDDPGYPDGEEPF